MKREVKKNDTLRLSSVPIVSSNYGFIAMFIKCEGANCNILTNLKIWPFDLYLQIACDFKELWSFFRNGSWNKKYFINVNVVGVLDDNKPHGDFVIYEITGGLL